MSKPGKSLKRICKKLGIRLTVKRGKRRVYKSVKVLKTQCKRKQNKKKKRKVKRKRRFGTALSFEDRKKIFNKLEKKEKDDFYSLYLTYMELITDEKGKEKKLSLIDCKKLEYVIYKMEEINRDLVPDKAYENSNKYCSFDI